jgi:hypothetical protein
LKFVWYWEYDDDKTDEVIKKFGEMMALREKGSQDVPKMIFGPFQHVGVSKVEMSTTMSGMLTPVSCSLMILRISCK